jgi:hypothetical protein
LTKGTKTAHVPLELRRLLLHLSLECFVTQTTRLLSLSRHQALTEHILLHEVI